MLGVGRLIAEAQVTPIVVPFWHEGKLLLLPSVVKYIQLVSYKIIVNLVTVKLGKP